MRRRILARMIASPTIVTEIGKIADIALVKLPAAGHCRKHRAKPLAIATSIANLHHPNDFTSRFWVEKRFEIKPVSFDIIG
jgi:hypothetical protein